jgi:hypothetical protein
VEHRTARVVPCAVLQSPIDSDALAKSRELDTARQIGAVGAGDAEHWILSRPCRSEQLHRGNHEALTLLERHRFEDVRIVRPDDLRNRIDRGGQSVGPEHGTHMLAADRTNSALRVMDRGSKQCGRKVNRGSRCIEGVTGPE